MTIQNSTARKQIFSVTCESNGYQNLISEHECSLASNSNLNIMNLERLKDVIVFTIHYCNVMILANNLYKIIRVKKTMKNTQL